MKRLIALMWLAAVPAMTQAQPARYEPTWESLDQRPMPQWWTDAKFGIFIHWGVYSVPAFASRGEYAEWYWERIGRPGDPDPNSDDARIRRETRAFHDRVYGVDFPYRDFAPRFRAEMFDADQWAAMLAESGAKYVVLASKHHDGYALWPSREADASWGHPWNSVTVGPERDLVGELTRAVRARGLEMGFYYSLYEWFNPLWLAGDVDAFLERHLIPQFKDLVSRYSPSLIFSDGEWDLPSEKWRTPELLAWLFNDSAVGQKVVVNDRWGAETRHRHGGYYTTEYGAGLPGATHAWEENRGMGHSFGYNRNENLADYATGHRLLLTLLDTVSRGGNLLLNIGPTADGHVPVDMQERLAYLGNWLAHNGEAVYGTRVFRDGAQWSAGRPQAVDTSTSYRAKYDIEKLFLSPDAGDARKEILFTRKGRVLYLIVPRYPSAPLVVRNLRAAKGATVSLLGSRHRDLQWRQRGADLHIVAPPLADGELPFGGAFVFRVDGIEESAAD